MVSIEKLASSVDSFVEDGKVYLSLEALSQVSGGLLGVLEEPVARDVVVIYIKFEEAILKKHEQELE